MLKSFKVKAGSVMIGLLAVAGCDARTALESASGSPQNTRQAVDVSRANATLSASERLSPRVSRALFERSLRSSVELRGPDGKIVDAFSGPAAWSLVPREGEPAADGALADYRGARGCADLDVGAGAGAPSLCFKMMGDVSSVGLNPREMSLEGVREWARERVPELGSLEFASGEREGSNGFSVVYAAGDMRGETYVLTVSLKAE